MFGCKVPKSIVSEEGGESAGRGGIGRAEKYAG